MCKSYNGIKEFQGPPAHWLKGHTDRVSKYKRKLTTEIFSHKSELRFRVRKIVLKVNAARLSKRTINYEPVYIDFFRERETSHARSSKDCCAI